MAEKLIAVPESLLTDIADAIRLKRDITDMIPVADMPMQVGLIEGGGTLPGIVYHESFVGTEEDVAVLRTRTVPTEPYGNTSDHIFVFVGICENPEIPLSGYAIVSSSTTVIYGTAGGGYGSIFRPDGTIGTDGLTVGYNKATKTFSFGSGNYGKIQVGKTYHMYLFMF